MAYHDFAFTLQFLAVLNEQIKELNEGESLSATETRELADELQRVRAMLPPDPPRVYDGDDDCYGLNSNDGDDNGAAAEPTNIGGRNDSASSSSNSASSRTITTGSSSSHSRPATPRSFAAAAGVSPGDKLRRRTRTLARNNSGSANVLSSPTSPQQRSTPSGGRDRTAALLGSTKARPRSARSAATQDALTEDLAAMAKQLRELSTVEGERLKADVVLGEALNDAADRNIENLAKAELTLKEQIANSGGCGIWLLLLFTGLSFFAALFLIKLTSK